VSFGMLASASILCGIGFTMALFIASLGLEGQQLEAAKLGILAGSGISLVLGLLALKLSLRGPPPDDRSGEDI
jgi:NhaA family Na+:H+ antiporter